MTTVEELSATPNALAAHYSRFRVAERLLLTGHSHQAWPDVALRGQIEAFYDAAESVDRKWDRAFRKADAVRAGFRRFLADPGAELALGANTHELVVRFLSALDLRARPRLVTTDGEFHSVRRQLARIAEADIEVVRVPAAPVDTLAQRLAAATDDRTAAVLVSAVLFETSRIVPGLDTLATACARVGTELLVDAYHAVGAIPFPLSELGLDAAWLVAGGYKYLQLGEGNCVLRIPPHGLALRPVITGWYAEFGELSAEKASDTVPYAAGANRFAGATYDPTSHYRAAHVFDFFTDHDLTPEFLRRISLHQTGLLADLCDKLDAPPSLLDRDRAPRTEFGGFLTLHSPQAARIQRRLTEHGVHTDSRGPHLRLGPAPYLSDTQIESAVAALGEVLREF
ncbi:aminotransferase class V-fold PLP-dependent enzyme [Nocardia panacis]|uniref:Aminotransferase class V-fold PLP-dependent enzyme n=1 Tax=Nocardia panacis TaxID=2340916 RepID=A0A3A4KIG2_9NOCA|nr:aminotransferase class V-fold PLP-dependent enzyme [Nocardia panacis]RJO76374.1 aminotransferase class V-fold PLP-dependent enzyme [Nocardia panacis]